MFRALAVLLALAVQIQATLPVGETGVRIAVADIMLPFSIAYAAGNASILGAGLRWRMPGVLFWLGAISVALTVALGIGYQALGHWSSWGLVNKYVGWFALAGYFSMGSAIVCLGGIELRAQFLKVFLFAAAAIAAINVLAMPWLVDQYTLPIGIEYSRATGAMQNANAFGFLLTVSALLLVARQEGIGILLPPVLAALWFTSSRGAMLALVAGLASYLFVSRRVPMPAVKSAAVAMGLVVLVTAAIFVVRPTQLKEVRAGYAPVGLLSAERINPDADSIRKREAQNAQAVALFARAPIFGQGLGYFVENTGESLHNSMLWLVLETGVIGFIAMGGFLSAATYYLYRGRDDPFLLGMFAAAIAFVVMSMTGEYLYQRHLWLLLGMALAVVPDSTRRR